MASMASMAHGAGPVYRAGLRRPTSEQGERANALASSKPGAVHAAPPYVYVGEGHVPSANARPPSFFSRRCTYKTQR